MVRTLILATVAASSACFHAAAYSPATTQAAWRAIRDGQDHSPENTTAADPSGGRISAAQAYEMALTHSPELAATEATQTQATALVGAARQIDNPQLRLTGFNVEEAIGNRARVDVGLRVPIPRPGTVRARVDAAKQVEQGQTAMTADAKRRLRATIDGLFARLAMHEAELELAATDAGLRLARRDDVVARVDQGVATQLDLAMAQMQAAESTDIEASIRAQIAVTEHELRRTIGATGPVTFATDRRALRVVDLQLDPAVLTERAMAERAELRASHASVVEAKADAHVAKAGAWPWFDWAQVEYRAEAGATPAAFGFGVALTLPVFSWNRGSIRASKAAVRVREHEQRAQMLAIAAEVEEAVARVERTAKRVESIEKELLPRIDAATGELEAALAAGVFDPAAAVRVDARAFEARRMHLAALLEHRQAVLDLETAVGVQLDDEGPRR